jgi:HlyD family secretion protein
MILLAAVAAGAFLIWKLFFATPAVPDSIAVLSGRLEKDDSGVAAKTTGRLLEVRVREGEVVMSGDIIAVLGDQQIRDREEHAQAALAEEEAKAAAARVQIAFREEQLRQNRLQTEQSGVDAEGRVRQAEADVAAAESNLSQQEAAYRLALFDRDAYTALAKTGAVSERQGPAHISKRRELSWGRFRTFRTGSNLPSPPNTGRG